MKPKEETSIFDQIDFYKGDEVVADQVARTEAMKEIPWFDTNDNMSTFTSVMPKDLGNLAQGQATYGIFEYITFMDDIIYNAWMNCAEFHSMGLCSGLVVVTLATRFLIMPVTMYSQIVGYKMKLLQPDMD